MRTGSAPLKRVPLSLCIALGLSAPALGQDQPVPGLYTSVTENEVYIIQPDGTTTDVKTGESVSVNQDGVEFISRKPAFLEWPCGTEFAGNRGSLPSFALEDLPPDNRIGQVADLYFTEQNVLETSPRFLNGGSHGAFTAAEIDQFLSNAYWYSTGPTSEKMALKRPPVLIIGLFYGTGQVIVDNNHLDDLLDMYGDEPIPVLFEYMEENVVPISYFGDAPTPQQIGAAYQERGIKPADVPVWFAGDRHVAVDPGALADQLGIPPASEINPSELARLTDDIEQNGFNYKPVTLAFLPGDQSILVDEGERLRAAQQLGMADVPVVFSVYDSATVGGECGLAPPVAAAGVLGTAEGDVSGPDSPDTPDQPDPPGETPTDPPAAPSPPVPPEITPPDPPQPELPVSDN